MSELIDRVPLIKRLQEIAGSDKKMQTEAGAMLAIVAGDAIKMLMNQPVIIPDERETARRVTEYKRSELTGKVRTVISCGACGEGAGKHDRFCSYCGRRFV